MRKIATRVLDNRLIEKGFLPKHETVGSAGADLRVVSINGTPVHDLTVHTVWPGDQVIVGTGVAMHIADPGLAGMLLPRSSSRKKRGFRLANTVGLCDSDYQGEIILTIDNVSQETPFEIEAFERIAQIVLVTVEQFECDIVSEFDGETDRGANGHGHTGA